MLVYETERVAACAVRLSREKKVSFAYGEGGTLATRRDEVDLEKLLLRRRRQLLHDTSSSGNLERRRRCRRDSHMKKSAVFRTLL